MDGTATTTSTFPTPPQDGKILHFLKECPGWVVVSLALIFFTVVYLNTKDDFIPRIIDALIGAFLGLVVAQRPRPAGSTNIKTDTVETPSVTTQTIDNSIVNTETLNTGEEKPKGENENV